MAVVSKTAGIVIQCPVEFINSINADTAISSTAQSITINDGTQLSITFSAALSGAEDTALNALITAWDNSACLPLGEVRPTLVGVTAGLSHQLSFLRKYTATNTWLSLYGQDITSNKTMGIMPFKSKLVAITFSNKKASADTDIRIYSTPNGGGYTPKTLDYTWTISNKRSAFKSDFTTDIIFDTGDKIGVYLADKGTDPEYPVVTLYFVALSNLAASGGETWSGDYGSGTGGGSS